MLAAGLGDLHRREGRAVIRERVHRRRAAGAVGPQRRLLPFRKIDLARSPRRADVLQHRKRPRALAAVGPVLFGEAHQALVLALVVPVRQEHGQQAQRVDVRARRAALLRIDQIELEERPAFELLGLDRAAVVLALDRDPLEVLVGPSCPSPCRTASARRQSRASSW